MEERPKVLVVDDEELAQDLLRFFLSKKFDVYTAGSVNAFYNLINRIDFDLIIMDVSLRDSKDGIELTKELKASEKYRNVPIFILTAYNTTKERQNAFAAGAEQFISKPTDTKALLKLIESVLVKPKLAFH
ncbi:MAG: response regulator [Bacteroidota bacterium]